MKKSFLLLLFSLAPIFLWADPVEINGIYYNLIDKGKVAEVTRKDNTYQYRGSVEIPELVSYEGTDYNVTSIGEGAFSHCTGLTSITIPSSVTEIDRGAFYECTGLTSITIPYGLTIIYESTFYGCSGLTSITIPNSVTRIDFAVFKGCTSLTNITIPNSVTSIGVDAFSSCTSLSSITIPNSVTSIGESAFSDCTGLTGITIPNSVTSIDNETFTGCTGLSSITIPNSVTSIGSNAFYRCTGLTNITIPNSVTSIGSNAFCYCTGLTSITIPNHVWYIDYNTFSGCTGLTSITIPNSVTSIANGAFSHCTGLTSITIPSSVTHIGDHSFENCPDLNDVFCYAENVPSATYDAFKDSYVEYATLHVPANSINKYKEAEPWKRFGNIVALGSETSDIPKCANPTISYENGVLKMACTTEGVEYVTEIADADIKKHYDSEITLSATYNISVYATKAGYDNSDVVNATLCWIDAEPKAEGITNGVANVNARAVLIQNNGGIITINGVEDGMRVSAYSLNGVEEAATISRNGAAVLNTNAQTGSTVIINLGKKAVKVLMK